MSASFYRVSHLLLGMALVAGLGLSGCGQSSSPQGEGPTPTAVEEEAPTLVTAEATLQLFRLEPPAIVGGGGHTEQPSVESFVPYIRTECHHLRSDLTIQRLLDTEAVRATGWFQGQEDLAAAHGALSDHVLTAAHIQDTTLIRVSATTAYGEDALAILRAWIGVYMQEVEARAESRYFTDFEAFQRQLEAIEAEIQNVEARIRRHLIDHPRASTNERYDVTTQELLFLNAKKREIDELLTAAETSHREMLVRNEEPYEPSPEEVQMIEQSRQIQQIDAQIRQFQVSREVLFDSGRDELHPQVQQLNAQIEDLENDRQTEFDSQARAMFNARLEMARQAAAIYREQSVLFGPRIEELRARLDDLNSAAAEFETMQRELKQYEDQREQARHAIRDMEVLIRRAGGYAMEVRTPPAIVDP